VCRASSGREGQTEAPPTPPLPQIYESYAAKHPRLLLGPPREYPGQARVLEVFAYRLRVMMIVIRTLDWLRFTYGCGWR
jgi:hypothetical protein